MPFDMQRDRLIAALKLDKRFQPPQTSTDQNDAIVEEDYRLSNYVAQSVPLILTVAAVLIAVYCLSDVFIGEVARFRRFLPVMGGTSLSLLILAFYIHRQSLRRQKDEVGVLGVITIFILSVYLSFTQHMQDQTILYSLPYIFLIGAVAVPFWPDRRYFVAGSVAAAVPLTIEFILRPDTDLLPYLVPLLLISLTLLTLVHETISRANRRMFALAYEVQYRASHDVMTTLSSRSHWLSIAADVYAAALRDKRPLCLFYLDIDHFKSINDRFGHDAGDETLKQVATELALTVPRRDFVARFGGEEFVKLLPGASLPQAIARARALHARINAIDHLPVPITISVGVAEAVPGQTLEQFITRADRAMLRAKESGRNRTVIATSDIVATADLPVDVPSASVVTEAALDDQALRDQL